MRKKKNPQNNNNDVSIVDNKTNNATNVHITLDHELMALVADNADYQDIHTILTNYQKNLTKKDTYARERSTFDTYELIISKILPKKPPSNQRLNLHFYAVCKCVQAFFNCIDI